MSGKDEGAANVSADKDVGAAIKDIAEKYHLPVGAIKIVDQEGNAFESDVKIEAVLAGWGNRP